MLQSVKVDSGGVGLVGSASAQAAQQILEGPPHVLVPERVDDGVDEGVALGQHQAVLLVSQHVALCAAQTVQEQKHQPGGPTQHEEP